MNISTPESEVLNRMRNVTQRIVQIPDEEWNFAKQFFRFASFDKNSYLVKAGEIADRSYFISSGLVRLFYITESGREFNKFFCMENSNTGSYRSLLLKEPSSYYIQALEPTEVVFMSRENLYILYERHRCWERFGRISAEGFILLKELREKELIMDSLETRYLQFLKEYPGLVDRIPQYHIASYLGVTDVALSRMRGRLKQAGTGNQ